MRTGTLLSAAAIWVTTISGTAGQDGPGTLCTFEGFSANPKMAEIASGKPATGYYGCSPAFNCQPTTLASGALVVVYKTEGDWTCAYLSNRQGAGPGWVRSKDIRMVNADPAPPMAAWLGTWANGRDRIRIQAAKAPGKLALEGDASWHGIGDVVHTGGFAGEAAPDGSHLHFVEADADSCIVDLTLIGKHLVANDNARCGGFNVRFWGIWNRAGK